MTSPMSPARPVRPTGAKVMMILGAVLVVIGIVAVSFGAARAGDGVDEIESDVEEVRRDLDAEIAIPAQTEVHLDAGRHYVYAFGVQNRIEGPVTTDVQGNSGSSSYKPDVDVAVTITDPSGIEVELDLPGLRAVFDGIGDVYVYREFLVEGPGTYVISTRRAPSSDGVDLEPVSSIGVGPPIGNFAHVTQVLAGGLLVLAGVLLGGFGALLFIIGLIWFFVGGRTPPPPTAGPWGYAGATQPWDSTTAWPPPPPPPTAPPAWQPAEPPAGPLE